jgi:membrane protein CcdC involved in cytochrome C biogenesis
MEVKVFTAAQIMCSLGFAAVVYFLVFRNADLFKVAALTATLAAPLVLSVYLGNKRGAEITTAFDPWLYVSDMMQVLGMKNRLTGVVALTGIALPIYLVGCLGLRVIGVPAILRAVFRPDQKSGLRFVLAFFVVIGLFIALTCSITPAGLTHAFNNSGWFLAQSKYVAWIFAVEVLQTLYRQLIARGVRPGAVAGMITVSAVVLSVPSTVQHFALERDPYRLYGKSLGKELQSYSLETLNVIDFLAKDAQPGDVALPGENLLAPILALTKCRVPLGYFAHGIVVLRDYSQRETAEKEFWEAWRLGKVRGEFLREVGVRYVAVNKKSDGIPAKIPPALPQVFENSEFAVFKVQDERSGPEKQPAGSQSRPNDRHAIASR